MQTGRTPLEVGTSDGVRGLGSVASWAYRIVVEEESSEEGSRSDADTTSEGGGEASPDVATTSASDGAASLNSGRLELVREARRRSWRYEDVRSWAAEARLRAVRNPDGGVQMLVTGGGFGFVPSRLEDYLTEAEFERTFGVSRGDFEAFKPYKQQIEKRKRGLSA